MEVVNGSVDPLDRVEALLAARWSCRAFEPEPLPDALVERLLAAAQRTASWCNAQPWRVHLVGGAALEAVREAFPRWAAEHADAPDFPWPAAYTGAYRERRRACGFALHDAVGVARGDRAAGARQSARNLTFFGAPHVALVTSDRDLGVYGAVDCGAWVSTFLLAARAAGVATVAQAALAAHPAFWRETLGLGDDRLVVCGVSFGRADAAHPANGFRTERAPLAEVVDRIDALPVRAREPLP
jgi:nitroreductase